ncbi:STAS domain-containing protein [Kineococcus glutinatus]|uniref:STAS domain-containing protein n=1 Tax=Kineococcus glutinatus TaxID=1070872 RepID=UPI0031E84A9D
MARDTTPPGDAGRGDGGRPRDIRPVDPGSVHVLYEPRATRVVLTGEIDAELGPDLLEAAEDALSSGRPLQVDAHHVTFMDSTGLAFLARLASRSRGRRVTLIRPPAVVRFLIETTNIVQLLDVVEEEPSLAPHVDDPEPA